VTAALGPSIGPCCYRVGPELRAAFETAGWSPSELDRWFTTRAGDLYLDLWQANVDQLQLAGLAASNISASRLCTACHPAWFDSYRRDGAGTGRMVGFIRSAKC
jgi:copper oxidase (laccase) domain-containing protein